MRAMRVRIDANVRGYRRGDVLDLPDEEAALLEEAGKATVLGDPDDKPRRRRKRGGDTGDQAPGDTEDRPGAPVLDGGDEPAPEDQE